MSFLTLRFFSLQSHKHFLRTKPGCVISRGVPWTYRCTYWHAYHPSPHATTPHLWCPIPTSSEWIWRRYSSLTRLWIYCVFTKPWSVELHQRTVSELLRFSSARQVAFSSLSPLFSSFNINQTKPQNIKIKIHLFNCYPQTTRKAVGIVFTSICMSEWVSLSNQRQSVENQTSSFEWPFPTKASINCSCRFRFVISLRFRSLVPNGILLYAADDVQTPSHFISLELVNGQLVFKHNAGMGTVRVTSIFRNYSDGGHEFTVRFINIA